MRFSWIGVLALASACTHGSAGTSPAAPATPASPAVAAVFSPPPVTPTPALAAGMAKLAFMRGVWRGPASGTSHDGTHYEVTQTERMGPMLGGDIVVIEGRGYRADGTTGFNAFAVVSFEPRANKYEMRSYAMGYAGTFELVLTDTGYTWEVPAGPNAVVKYTATITPTTWHEVGAFVAAGKPPVEMFSMTLTKVGDTDWPLGTPIAPN